MSEKYINAPAMANKLLKADGRTYTLDGFPVNLTTAVEKYVDSFPLIDKRLNQDGSITTLAGIITDGLILELDAKSINNTDQTPVWHDRSGNNNNFTLNNFAYTPESGYDENGGLKFDGVDDYGAGPKLYDIDSSLTITCNMASDNVGVDDILLALSSNTYLCISSGKLDFRNVNHIRGDINLADGLAHVVTVAIDRGLNKIKLYVDDKIDIEIDYILGDYSAYSAGCLLGARGGPDLLFDGSMFKILCYNRALSDEEIKQNYNAIKGGK